MSHHVFKHPNRTKLQNEKSSFLRGHSFIVISSQIHKLSEFFPDLVSIKYLPPKIFGYVVYVCIRKQHRLKLDPRAQKCIFVDYSNTQKGISVTIPLARNLSPLWMSHLMKLNLFFFLVRPPSY